MARLVQILLCVAPFFASANAALRIASALGVIEYTPEKVAAEDFYNGSVTIVNGGVPNLFSDSIVDLASNAETQALRNFAKHDNLRIIYTIAEVGYRIVVDKRRTQGLENLKGKKIGAVEATSSAYFIQRILGKAGLKKGNGTNEYQISNANQCVAAPCGNGTLPYNFEKNRTDAVGFWEPTVELAARAIGKQNAVFYQDFDAYREIFSLHTTAEKLKDPAKRREIVAFLRALDRALEVFRDQPEKVYKRAADALKMDEELMRAVWDVHRWTGKIPEDLEDVLVEEDEYVAGVDKRQRLTGSQLGSLVDRSVEEELRGKA